MDNKRVYQLATLTTKDFFDEVQKLDKDDLIQVIGFLRGYYDGAWHVAYEKVHKGDALNLSDVKRLVTFALLVSGDSTVLERSPDYILEKWELIKLHPEKFLPSILDNSRRARYNHYLETWKIR